jgi:glycosyltransferase involved in cell wall biosynthesis
VRIVHVLSGAADNRCGVHDYTKSLVDALAQVRSGTECALVTRWSLRETLRVASEHRGHIIHVQYPSLQMGKAPWWSLLAFFGRRTVVTLHEYRIFSTPRKLYCLPAAVMAQQIIFSNAEERRAFLRWYPFAAKSSVVVPIGNNIPVVAAPQDGRARRLVYFGQISEGKGLEQVIEAVAELRQNGSAIPVAFIGAIAEPNSPIADLVRTSAVNHGIDLRLNLSNEDVSRELVQATHAYLPFPDGVTDKRGSALACLKHGVSVLTTHTGQTPDWLRAATTNCDGPSDAVRHVMAPELPSIDAAVLAAGLAEREWPAIAKRHLGIYDGLAGQRGAMLSRAA